MNDIFNDFSKMNGQIAIGLFGAGGFAREVMPVVAETAQRIKLARPDLAVTVYFVDQNPAESEVNGYPVLSEETFFELPCDARYFNTAIGSSAIREKVSMLCASKGVAPLALRASHTVVYDNNDIGEGAVLCAFSTITSNARIGRFFQSNIYSYVGHDCVIGDYVTFAPNVHCNGNVHIHNHAYIGTGAILRHGTPEKPLVIGEGAVVGMGAVVTKDVPARTTVVGSPAKPMIK